MIMTKLSFFHVAFLLICIGGQFACLALGQVNDEFSESYDFIVVGAGSAGAVIANRLSENKKVNVLLVEAGQDEDPILNEIPKEMSSLEFTEQDWNYKTEPQTAPAFGTFQPFFNWPRGKVLGGSSAMNFMMYLRGNKRDYDGWNQSSGGSGWAYKDVLPFFKKSEDSQVASNSDEYHGKNGYLTVTENKYTDPLAAIFLAGGRDLNMPTLDNNGPIQTGLMAIQSTIRDGARCSTNKAFLKSAANRPNLQIATGAFVTKILFRTLLLGVKQAYAVNITQSGKSFVIKASKEVIVSGGGINSPHLLLLSGIGPAKQLKALNIPVVADLPGVGENLQDHVSTGAIIYTIGELPPGSCPVTDDFQSAIVNWSYNRTGLLANSPVFATGFANTPLVDASLDYPDIQFITIPLPQPGITGDQFAAIFNVPEDFWKLYWEPVNSETAFILSPLVMRPKSRGFIRLRSADPFVHPIIDPQYFSDPAGVDFNTLIEGCKLVLKFGETAAFKNAGMSLRTRIFPPCAGFEIWSDAYLKCLIEFTTVTIFHPVGTCKMGADNDPLAVVDHRLNVRKVTGLRVADASIMPTVTTGNTNAPSIMIGERTSDFIKKDWGI